MTLFDDDVGRVEPDEPDGSDQPDGTEERERVGDDTTVRSGAPAHVVRVLPDIPAMDRALDYALPERLVGRVSTGTLVRIPLHGRRVRGWVVETDVSPEPGRELAEVAKVTGLAVDAEVVDLARWVAWRWVGRLPSVLRQATPDRVVAAPSRRPVAAADATRVQQGSDPAFSQTRELLDRGPGTHVYRVSPCTDHGAVALGAAVRGQALVITPSADEVTRVASVLGRAGATVVQWPGGTAGALAGHSVVGGRTAALAPMPALAAVVVLDEHDERHQNESSPTWHARDVAIERARRAGVPCLLVSPMPSLEAISAAATMPTGSSDPISAGSLGPVASVGASARRAGWARIEVADRRTDDPRNGLFSPRFAGTARRELDSGRAVLCVLNRTGRSRLLACRTCDTIAGCEACGAAVRSSDDEVLECIRCATTRPKVCLRCGSQAMKVLRMGVSRVREDLGALLGREVGLVTATEAEIGSSGLVVGTDALLHRRPESFGTRIGMVAFLDFDQELLAGRYRASEQALAALVLSSRLTGGRDGLVMVQTRNPDHEVLRAAVAADSTILSDTEWSRRELLDLPPAASIAAVGGEAAGEWIARLGAPPGIAVQGPQDGWWLLRADDPGTLAAAAGAVKRPAGRLRLRVDPMQLPVT